MDGIVSPRLFCARSPGSRSAGRRAQASGLALLACLTTFLGAGADGAPLLPDARPQGMSAAAGSDPGRAALDLDKIDTWDTGADPTAAVLMTPLFPGWGQLYTRNSWRAALAFGTEMYFWSNLIARDQRAQRSRRFAQNFVEGTVNHVYYNEVAEEDWNQMRDFAWWSGGALLIIALDAYVGAHLFNFDQDPIPVPNRWDDAFDPPGADMPGGSSGPSLTVFQWRKTF